MRRVVVVVLALAAGPALVRAIAFTSPAQTASAGQRAPAHLSAADEKRLNALIAQHQHLRSRLSADDQQALDGLTAHVRKELFAAPPRGTLLPAATRIVGTAIPGLTKTEAASLAEYTLGGIAAGGSGQDALLNATKQMQETQMSFNLQYLQLQSQMQHENRSYTAISNIMKTKHDTVKNSISNIR